MLQAYRWHSYLIFISSIKWKSSFNKVDTTSIICHFLNQRTKTILLDMVFFALENTFLPLSFEDGTSMLIVF